MILYCMPVLLVCCSYISLALNLHLLTLNSYRDSGESDSGHEAPSTNGTRASQGADEEEEAVKEQGEHGAAGVILSKEEEGQSNDTANTHTETNGVSRSDFSDHMDVDA